MSFLYRYTFSDMPECNFLIHSNFRGVKESRGENESLALLALLALLLHSISPALGMSNDLNLKPVQGPTSHPKPNLSSIHPNLVASYSPSPDKVDTNLLIFFHGLGKQTVSST